MSDDTSAALSTTHQNPTPTNELFVVGVGASAGGLDAIERLFSSMPVDTNMAFVVVQHLSPDFESLMDELLARHTSMPIHRVKDGMQVEANGIYLIPPKKNMMLSQGKLLLTDQDSTGSLNLPIDIFFRSIAQDAGNRAIAIVLSGTGSDGSRGLREVHDAGGLVLVQDLESASFDGMPRSAVSTEVVDVVCPPELMPQRIQEYLRSPHEFDREQIYYPDGLTGTGDRYEIFRLFRQKFGIDFSLYKPATIDRRIERRAQLTRSNDLQSYVESLKSNSEELNTLYRDLLVEVRQFFRDPEAFDIIRTEVLPRMIADAPEGNELRAWVPGCATGEEAYSLAMLLQDEISCTDKNISFKVFATDVHQDSLELASAGVYTRAALENVPEDFQSKFFTANGDLYHISRELRQRVIFAPNDITRDPPFTKIDFISCRDVLIYLEAKVQKKVLSLFHFGLETGGILFLGPSESLGDIGNDFATIDRHWRIYRKERKARLPMSTRLPMTSPLSRVISQRPPFVAKSPLQGTDPILANAFHELLSKYVPPSLLVNEYFELVHSFGDATKLLIQPEGCSTLDVLKMVNGDLRMAMSAALHEASQQRSPVVYKGVRVNLEDGEVQYKVVVEPYFKDNHRMYLISMERIEVPVAPDPSEEQFDVQGQSSERIEVLEQELAYTRESLQSTVEELETSNEELQSTNEELIASNEELQSTNEELRSVNEELYTVNAEHQRKIDELIELTDDMDNLLNSTNIHTIFLDRQLRIRRFSPGIRETINLLSQDIGRPFGSFTHNINHENLTRLAESVIDSKSPVEQEVLDKSNNWYLLRILPYQTRGQVDGAVLTLIDITSLKQAELKLAELSEIVEHSDDAIFRQDIDGTIRTWNRGAERLFAIKAPKVLGGHVEMLGLDCRDIEFGKILKLTASGESLDHIEARHKRQDGDFIDIAISVSPIRDVNGKVIGASTIARDVTRQKQAEAEVRKAVKRRDDFLAMLSHELRNPLAAVLNATNLMSEIGIQEKPIEEAKDVIEHNVRHVARILDDLLDVSRIANDKINLHKEVVDLCSLTIDVVECLQHRIDEKEQELHVHQPPEPLYVEGDVGRLQQMQVNLLVNASKYTGEKGRIEYEMYQDGDEAIITVTDNGVGIPESLLNTIFEPFVQADQTIDRAQGGMGLGLTLVSKVAEAHGGTVTAKSGGNGMGSCFSIILPITRKRPKSQVQTELTEIDGLKLVIVEDNDGVRNMLARTLELKGFVVATAATGREGIELIQQMHPTVAVIDIGLPDLNGYEVANEIRDDPELRGVLKVALTGYGRDRDQQKAIEAGFDIHLVKPLDPDELLRAVAEKYVAISS